MINNLFKVIIPKIKNIKLNKYILILILVLTILSVDMLLNNMFLINSISYNIKDTYTLAIPEGQSTPNPTDPVRYWPSGVPQSISIIGTSLAVFGALSKLKNCSPRLRVLAALGAAGASATQITYQTAIENPVGFNRFMFGLTHFHQTGKWPSLESIEKEISEAKLEEFVRNALAKSDPNKVNSILTEAQEKIQNSTNFFPDNSSNIADKLMDIFFNNITYIIKPVQVEGYFDDLIGQQTIIHIILFILVISLILLFIFFLINVAIILNKDKILNKFNNKFIKFYIKYQILLAKLSLIYVPIFIIIGLLTLAHGFYFLIKNQIPFDALGIDLHTFISNKK